MTTYPNFVEFLQALGVDSEPSNMSFALSIDKGQLEWASHGLNSVFAQLSNLYNAQFLIMLYEVVKFGK